MDPPETFAKLFLNSLFFIFRDSKISSNSRAPPCPPEAVLPSKVKL